MKKDRKEYLKKYRLSDAGIRANRNSSWKNNYGIKNKDGSFFNCDNYYWWLKFQGNMCSICETKKPGIKNWQVDHDHKTGVVRGLLCFNCNILLGKAKDDIYLLKKACNYLERSL